MNENITTWSGLVVLVLVMIFKDVIFKRLSEPREQGKAANLDEQTVLLRQMLKQKKSAS